MNSDSNSKSDNLPPVRIVKVLPNVPEPQVLAHRQCYLGISLENPVFAGDSFAALLNWAAAHFERCLIIVGDYLCRYNGILFDGMSQEKACEQAIRLGDDFLQKNTTLLSGFDSDQFQITRWKEHVQSPHFISNRRALGRLFDSSKAFAAAIEKDAAAFIKRQQNHKRTLAVDKQLAIRLCCEYLLEEIAVFSAVSEQGWHVELYPGPELSVLAEIENGQYDGIPTGLKQRINVELHIGHHLH